jgi:hypothetical protein
MEIKMIIMEMTDSEVVGLLMSDENANWSVNQAFGLVEFLGEVHDEDNPYTLDVIALRCEFSGYKSIEECAKEYTMTVEELVENALIIFCDDGEIVIQDF